MASVTAHRATTANLQALYPFVASPGLGSGGTYIGQEECGDAFCFDPWALYPHHITNPNILIAGQLGRGKSTLVKSLVARGILFGKRAAVLDPKGEYGPLAAAFGVEPVRLRPGGTVRLNPLDAGPCAGEHAEEVDRRRLSLLQSVAGAALGRDLTPIERVACRIALESRTSGRATPTIPEVAEALLSPSQRGAASIRTTRVELARSSRDVALELRRLCDGDLAGMFDGESTVDVHWDGPLVMIDLSALGEDSGLPVLMACATSWIQAAIVRPDGGHRFVVLDEAWRLLHHLGTARWLRASLKLARGTGVSNIMVLHRLSDLLAAGDHGSEQVQIAEGLLSDTETRIIYAQPEGETQRTADLLGLSASERTRMRTLDIGDAIWKVGRTSHLVTHVLAPGEHAVVDTDARMSETGDGFPAAGTASDLTAPPMPFGHADDPGLRASGE